MDNKLITVSEDCSQDFGDTEDDLSLCNFQISGYEHDDRSRRASNVSDFEFSAGFGNDGVSFCDEINDPSDSGEVNEYRKRDYLCLKSASFQKSRDYQFDCEGNKELDRSGSNRCRSGKSWPVQKVNITAITDMSEKSRRRMFMFGPVKFKPEMDVSAIRKRQSRLAPVQIPPMPEEWGVVVKSGGRGKSAGGAGGHEGGALRPLWCRSHLATALFGCVSSPVV